MLEEILLLSVSVVSAFMLVPWLAFALASLFEGFPRLRLGQVLGMIGVSAWVLGFIVTLGPGGGTELLLLSTIVLCLLAFAGMWTREFRLLMLRRADEFPDRLDKLAWVFVLTALAPAGVWLFRSYRKDRWPQAAKAAARRHPLDPDGPFEGVDDPAMERIGA